MNEIRPVKDIVGNLFSVCAFLFISDVAIHNYMMRTLNYVMHTDSVTIWVFARRAINAAHKLERA